jgi:hypothetical protein
LKYPIQTTENQLFNNENLKHCIMSQPDKKKHQKVVESTCVVCGERFTMWIYEAEKRNWCTRECFNRRHEARNAKIMAYYSQYPLTTPKQLAAMFEVTASVVRTLMRNAGIDVRKTQTENAKIKATHQNKVRSVNDARLKKEPEKVPTRKDSGHPWYRVPGPVTTYRQSANPQPGWIPVYRTTPDVFLTPAQRAAKG